MCSQGIGEENFILTFCLPLNVILCNFEIVAYQNANNTCNVVENTMKLFDRLAYGNDTGLVVVDTVQKLTLLVMATSDFGGSGDPQRALRSPKRQDESARRDIDDKARSPSLDQVMIMIYFLF